MERLLVSDPQAIARAEAVLASGGVILYPTDTLYGLGVDALSDEAVAKLYVIKGREAGKPIHCIVADMEMAQRYAEVTPLAVSLAWRFLPGALTLILKKKPGTGSGIARGIDTIGIRIPLNDFCRALARRFGKPYTTTSANVSGAAPGRSVDDILEQLGERGRLIDLVIDAGELPLRLPSTVVDASSGQLLMLREGAIPVRDIDNAVLL